MLRLLSYKAQELKRFWKSSKSCHVGFHWKALIEYLNMSTHLPRSQSFFSFFTLFCIGQISHQQHSRVNPFIPLATPKRPDYLFDVWKKNLWLKLSVSDFIFVVFWQMCVSCFFCAKSWFIKKIWRRNFYQLSFSYPVKWFLINARSGQLLTNLRMLKISFRRKQSWEIIC